MRGGQGAEKYFLLGSSPALWGRVVTTDLGFLGWAFLGFHWSIPSGFCCLGILSLLFFAQSLS